MWICSLCVLGRSVRGPARTSIREPHAPLAVVLGLDRDLALEVPGRSAARSRLLRLGHLWPHSQFLLTRCEGSVEGSP